MPWVTKEDNEGNPIRVFEEEQAPAGMVWQQVDGGGEGGYDSRLIADTSKYTQKRSAQGGAILEILNDDTGQWERGVYDIANPDVMLPASVAQRLGIRAAPALGHVAGHGNLLSELASDPNFVQFALSALGPSVSSALGGALGSKVAGNVATGALKSLISGGDPLMGALSAGVTPALGALGVPDAIAPALGGAIRAGISGGDPLMAALTSGAGSLASALTTTDSPVYDTTGDTDMTGFQTDPGEIDWGPTSSPLDAPDYGAMPALENTGFFPEGFTVDLGNSGQLTNDFSTTAADIGQGGSMDDIDMTGFYTPSGEIDWGGGSDSLGMFDGTDNSGMFGDSGALGNSIWDTGGENDYISKLLGGMVNLGDSSQLMPTGTGGTGGTGGIQNVSQLVKSLLGMAGGGAAAGGAGGATGGAQGGMSMKDLLPYLLLGGGALESIFKDNSTKSEVKLPDWYTDASKKAISAADELAAQPFKKYTGDAVADLSENERMAIQMAKDSAGTWQPLLDDATAMTKASTQSVKDMDLTGYMNPYLDNVYTPAKRQLERDIAKAKIAQDARAGKVGAFGGTRNAIESSLLDERKFNALSDLYSTGQKNAYDNATALATGDLTRKANAGSELKSQAGATSALIGTDIGRLGQTGTVARNVDQAGKDFDVGEFNKEQDWAKRKIDGYTAALRGNPGSTTTSTPASPSLLGQTTGALGALKTIQDNGWFS